MTPPPLEAAEIALRLAIAGGLGALLGLDREQQDKPAGLRTHMLISMAAAALTMLAFALAASAVRLSDEMTPDPVRIVEAVVTGVAFLGAGAIIRGRSTIHGFTTGASMWLAGAVGLASGAGEFILGAIAAVFGLFVLLPVRWLERWLWREREAAKSLHGERSEK
jgi:putative Mg2+ transporter-C (MgtC) family protein